MRSKRQGAAVVLTKEDIELLGRRVYNMVLKGEKAVLDAIAELGVRLSNSERAAVIAKVRELDADGDIPAGKLDVPDEPITPGVKLDENGMPEVVGTANANAEPMRIARKLDGFDDVDPETVAGWRKQAAEEKVAQRAEIIAGEVLRDSKRRLSKVEEVGFQERLQDIKTEYEPLIGKTDDVSKARIAELDEVLDLITEAANKTGTETARALAARAHGLKSYEPALAGSRYRTAAKKGGIDPDPDVVAEIQNQAVKIQEKDAQIAELQARVAEAKEALAAQERAGPRKPRSKVARAVEDWVLDEAQLRQAFAEVLASPVSMVLGVGPGGGGATALGRIAKHYVAKGILTVDGLVQAMSAGIKQVKPDAKLDEAALRSAAEEALGEADTRTRKAMTPEQRIKAEEARLKSEIAKLEKELETGEFSEPAERIEMPDEVRDLRKRVGELRQQKKEAKAGGKEAYEAAQEAERQARKAASEARAEARKAARAQKREAEAPMRQAQAAARKKAKLEAELADLREQVRTKNYNAYWKRAAQRADDDLMDLRQQVRDHKKFIDSQIKFAERGKGNVIDQTDSVLRTFALFNIGNRLKDLFGNGLSVAEFLALNKPMRLVEKARFRNNQGVPNITEADVAYAVRGAAGRIKDEIGQVWKYGDADLAGKLNIVNESPGILKKIDRITGMSDIPARDFAFRVADKSLARDLPGMDPDVRAGYAKDISDAVVFMAENKLSQMYTGALHMVPQGAARSMTRLAINLVARFPKVIGNVMGTTTDYMVGGIKAAGQDIGKLIDKTVWTPTERNLYAKRVARNGLGVGLYLIGKKLYEDGLIAPDDSKAHLQWNEWLEQAAGPVQIILMAAEMAYWAQKGNSKEFRAVAERLSDHPYFGAMRDITYAAQSEKGAIGYARKLGYRNLAPSQLREAFRKDWIPGMEEFYEDFPEAKKLMKPGEKKPSKKSVIP